jgi:hypothetical protein
VCHDVCYRLIFRSVSFALNLTESIRHSCFSSNLHCDLNEEMHNCNVRGSLIHLCYQFKDHLYTCITNASNKLSLRKSTVTCFPDVFTTCNRSLYKHNCVREISWPGFPTKSTEYFVKARGISSPL